MSEIIKLDSIVAVDGEYSVSVLPTAIRAVSLEELEWGLFSVPEAIKDKCSSNFLLDDDKLIIVGYKEGDEIRVLMACKKGDMKQIKLRDKLKETTFR